MSCSASRKPAPTRSATAAPCDEIEIALQFSDGRVAAQVKDRGHGFDIASFDPHLPADPRSERGRGLVIMAALMDSLELRLDGGLEVRMARSAAARFEPQPLETGLGEPHDTSPLDHRDTRTRAMLEEIDEAFVALDWEYRFVHANEAALRMAFKPLEELSGATLWKVFPTMTESPLAEALRAAMELGRPSVIEYQTHLSGTWLEARIYPTSVGVSAYYREINERKRIEQEARPRAPSLRPRLPPSPTASTPWTASGA